MTNNRIKELRKARNLTQKNLGKILGITQQTMSKVENSKYEIPTDLLILISKYFDVTTDYILGLSDVKKIFENQYKKEEEVDKYHEFLRIFKALSEEHQKIIIVLLRYFEK